MPGPITQLLTLADLEPVPEPPERAPRVRTRPPRNLAAWRIGIAIGTAWTVAVAALAISVRF